MTSEDGQKIRNDLFQLQTRILELENQVDKGGKASKTQGEAANQRIASTSARLEGLETEIRKLAGEIDMLRLAVKTGELPGSNPDEESLAKTLNRIQERLSASEETQRLILEKINSKNPGRTTTQKPLRTLKEIESAFEKERYSQIVQDAPLIIDKLANSDRANVRYFYAESLFKQKKYSDAALAFNSLLKENALKDKYPDIHLKLGESFRSLGDLEVAKVYYSELIEKFPKSKAADLARSQMAKLKSKSKT